MGVILLDNLDGRVNLCYRNDKMTAYTGYGILPEATNAVFTPFCRVVVRVANSTTTVYDNATGLTAN